MRTYSVLKFFVIAVCCISLVGCDSDDKEEALTCADWGYESDNGPAKWGSLCDARCGSGGKQSPVNIVVASAQDVTLPAIEFTYKDTEMELFNNGHTIEAADEHTTKSNSVKIGANTYQLLQFHFHAKSEHTIDGKASPLELHLVHKKSDTELAVLGVMINEGAANTAFTGLWSDLPKTKTTAKRKVTVNPISLLPPGNREYYRYDGSLTTPNGTTPASSCAEIVNWHVLKAPITMSKAQLDAFTAIFPNNYRPPQDLKGRVVQK